MSCARLALAIGLAACSGGSYQVAELGDPGAADGGAAANPDFPVTGIGSSALLVTGVEPASGPFSGGNRVLLRGSGFKDGLAVRIGGHSVEPSTMVFDGSGRVELSVPAGEVGAADVSVKLAGSSAKLRDGYYYNALQLVPAEGSTAGGTSVEITISGGELDQKSVIELDGVPCTELKVLGPKRVRCKTPKHAAGSVDVTAYGQSEGDAQALFVAKAAFNFIETSNVGSGGLSGGAIDGTLNVTVVDSGGGRFLPGAFVLVGNDPTGKYQGYTDARGSITFSGSDLKGPVSVHASLKCFERSSIVAFDAQNATLFLSPILDFSCADEGDPQQGHGVLGSYVSGQLVFPGSDEFGINPWDIVPKPKADEIRVAYVFTTQSSANDENPPPQVDGTDARLEEASAKKGSRGYLYSIFARPAGLAVYALAGLERIDDGKFTAYAMGIARNVVTAPGDETKQVDIDMSITLDRELEISMSDLPKGGSSGPDLYRVRALVDLGGEGVIVRDVGGESLDTLERYTPGGSFRFFGQPAFIGALQDASYEVVAGFYTEGADLPYTSLRRVGVLPSAVPLPLSGFLGIPQVVAPAIGAQIPKDRVLRFDVQGAEPDLFEVELIGGDGNPAWSQILPGSARSVPLPDFSKIDKQSDIAEGFITWSVKAIELDEFDYDRFQYTQLATRYVTHVAENAFTMRR